MADETMPLLGPWEAAYDTIVNKLGDGCKYGQPGCEITVDTEEPQKLLLLKYLSPGGNISRFFVKLKKDDRLLCTSKKKLWAALYQLSQGTLPSDDDDSDSSDDGTRAASPEPFAPTRPTH